MAQYVGIDNAVWNDSDVRFTEDGPVNTSGRCVCMVLNNQRGELVLGRRQAIRREARRIAGLADDCPIEIVHDKLLDMDETELADLIEHFIFPVSYS